MGADAVTDLHHIDVKTVTASCCSEHMTKTVECCCGWKFNEQHRPLRNGEAGDAIRDHRRSVVEEALGIEFNIRFV